MSKPPKSNAGITFPDPDHHTRLIQLRKDIRRTLIDLRPHFRKGEDRTRMIQFSNVLHPGGIHDTGRLPYEGKNNGRSHKNRVEDAVAAKIAQMISNYWWLVLEEDKDTPRSGVTLEATQEILEELRVLVHQGLSKCRVEGSETKGFQLIVPMPEEE